MKRTIALASALALALGLAACSSDDGKDKPLPVDVQPESSAPDEDVAVPDGDVAVPGNDADGMMAVDTHADLFAIYEDYDELEEQPGPQILMKVNAYEDGPKAAVDAFTLAGKSYHDAVYIKIVIDNRSGDDDLDVTSGTVTDKDGKRYDLESVSDTVGALAIDEDDYDKSDKYYEAEESMPDVVSAGAIGTQWFMSENGLPDKASRFTLDIGGFQTQTPVSEVSKAEGSNAFEPGALDFTDPNEK